MGDIRGIFKNRAFKRGFSPSFYFFPLSFEGEGDKGGEVKVILVTPTLLHRAIYRGKMT
jgi:hypothetical protein